MDDSIELFEKICNNEYFTQTTMFLFLNKTDLFAEKIKTVPITECASFASFEGDTTSYEETTQYIQQEFEARNHTGKPLYVHFTNAIDKDQMDKVFNDTIFNEELVTPY